MRCVVVPRERPELLGARLERGVVAAVGVAPRVAHPDVEPRVRQEEPEAAGGAVDDPAGGAVEQPVLQQDWRPAAK